jgi:ATP-dependent DNA ligase
MNTMYDYLKIIETTGPTSEKEYFLRKMLEKFENAERFLRLTFNDTVYGLAEKSFYNAFFKDPDPDYSHVSNWLYDKVQETNAMYWVTDLEDFSEKIAKESGSQQLHSLRDFFSRVGPIKAKWFCRALLHDLRCGVQVKTVNKVFKQLGLKKIPKFAMQLCGKVDIFNKDDVARRITFPCAMEKKEDGYRIQAEVWPITDDEMGCILMSRRGNDRTDSYPEIVEELKYRFSGQHVLLDGEVKAKTFQSLTRKDDKSQRIYTVFDLLNDEKLKYIDRWDNLVSLFTEVGLAEASENPINNIKVNTSNSVIQLIEHYSANNLEDIQAYYGELIEQGEEGIILKNFNKPYERGSRKNMWKCKPVYTADLKIIGYKLGEGKRANKIATLELIDKSETIRVDVGSGIDDDMCEWLTEQAQETIESGGDEAEIPWMYTICEIKYSEFTETGSLRFPRFVKLRDDKDEEDDLNEVSFGRR